MPFNRPISEDKTPSRPGKSDSRGLGSLVQAEKLMQIAFVLPCAMVIGWALGWCVDHFFHLHWATIAGLIFGIIAGMVSVIRMAMEAMNSLSPRKPK